MTVRNCIPDDTSTWGLGANYIETDLYGQIYGKRTFELNTGIPGQYKI